MKRMIALLLGMVFLLGGLLLPVQAAEAETSDLLDIGYAAPGYSFTISSTGLASLRVTYRGDDTVVERISVTSYLEKKTLGLFWLRVNIGTDGNEWFDTCAMSHTDVLNQFQLKSKGTYRATFKVQIINFDGTERTYNEEIIRTYS